MKAPVIIAYVPVLHEGYHRLFQKYPKAKIYILGADIVSANRVLVKDLRALDPELVKQALSAWRPAGSVEVADKSKLEALAKAETPVVMPDEDISHDLAERYFNGHEVEFSPVFLRWDRRRSSAQEAVAFDHEVTAAEADANIMKTAHAEAARSADIWRRVGAVLVAKNGAALKAHNQAQPSSVSSWTAGDPRNNFGQGAEIDASLFAHAEAALIARAARTGVVTEGASLYVTTFPCPTCAKLIAGAGVAKLYYARGYSMLDGDGILKAGGVKIIKVSVHLEEDPPEVWKPYPNVKTQPNSKNRKLVLFNIGGTLIEGTIHNREAQAVNNVHEISVEIKEDFRGYSDKIVLAALLRNEGWAEDQIKGAMPDLLRELDQVHKRSFREGSIKIMPGVLALLNTLKEHDVLLGLTTANLKTIARRKLEAVGLYSYFSVGGFGDDPHTTRADLIRLAIQRAGFEDAKDQVYIIGDTQRDIFAANEAGIVHSIGVSNGDDIQPFYDAGAEAAFESFTNTANVLAKLGISAKPASSSS
jgi:dCMP deaminase